MPDTPSHPPQSPTPPSSPPVPPVAEPADQLASRLDALQAELTRAGQALARLDHQRELEAAARAAGARDAHAAAATVQRLLDAGRATDIGGALAIARRCNPGLFAPPAAPGAALSPAAGEEPGRPASLDALAHAAAERNDRSALLRWMRARRARRAF